MIIDNVTFILKDGKKALLTCPEEKHVLSTLEFLHKTSNETEFILRYPEECDRFTAESEKELFYGTNASESDCMLICVIDERVVGICSIAFKTHIKTKHRATVGIVILKKFWNLGIGTKMFETLISLAKEREGVSQIELDFVEGNSRARALYEKMGFRIVSCHPNAIKLKDGRKLSEYLMILEI